MKIIPQMKQNFKVLSFCVLVFIGYVVPSHAKGNDYSEMIEGPLSLSAPSAGTPREKIFKTKDSEEWKKPYLEKCDISAPRDIFMACWGDKAPYYLKPSNEVKARVAENHKDYPLYLPGYLFYLYV